MEKDRTVFGARLRLLRGNLGISIYELSKKTTISAGTLRRYEDGEIASPTIKHIIELCRYFNCTADFIIGLKDNTELSPSAIEVAKIFDSMKSYEQSWCLLLVEAVSEKMTSLRRQKLLSTDFLSNVQNSP